MRNLPARLDRGQRAGSELGWRAGQQGHRPLTPRCRAVTGMWRGHPHAHPASMPEPPRRRLRRRLTRDVLAAVAEALASRTTAGEAAARIVVAADVYAAIVVAIKPTFETVAGSRQPAERCARSERETTRRSLGDDGGEAVAESRVTTIHRCPRRRKGVHGIRELEGAPLPYPRLLSPSQHRAPCTWPGGVVPARRGARCCGPSGAARRGAQVPPSAA